MVGISWALAFSGLAVVAAVLWRRRRSRSKFLTATAVVRLTNEIWNIANAVPPQLLSAPLRDAISVLFTSYAEYIANTQLAAYGAKLAERAALVHRLPKTSNTIEAFKGADQRFTRLANLLDIARTQGHLDQREHALARVAAGLSAELASIDSLCLQAEHALSLRSTAEAMHLHKRALAACERLPQQTAGEVRRRIDSRLGQTQG